MARDDSRFYCGHTTAIGKHAFFADLRRAQTIAQSRTRFVIPDDSKAFNSSSQRREISSHIAAATQSFALLHEIHYGNGGLR